MLIGKNIEQIKLEDINALVENNVSEGQFIDFKIHFPELDSSDEKKKEFLADICSFANAEGGYIVYGIKEEKGFAVGLNPQEVIDPDKTKLSIGNLIDTALEPRIQYKLEVLESSEKQKYFLLIQISSSWVKPHWVSYKRSNKFYMRDNGKKHLMTIDELRNAFVLGSSLLKLHELQIKEKIDEIKIGKSPARPFAPQPHVFLKLTPLSSVQSNKNYNVIPFLYDDRLKPLLSSGHSPRINMSGIIITYRERNSENSYASYTQLSRKGEIECCFSLSGNPGTNNNSLPLVAIERKVAQGILMYLEIIKELGLYFPVIVDFQILGIKDFTARRSNGMLDELISYPDKDLAIPSIVMSDQNSVNRVIKDIFDICWNAFGCVGSPSFDQDGNLK